MSATTDGCSIEVYGKEYKITLRFDLYIDGGRLAIMALDEDGGPWGHVTVNDTSVPLFYNEVIVKDYSEGADWIPQLLHKMPDVFKDTGKKAVLGYARASIWSVNPELLD